MRIKLSGMLLLLCLLPAIAVAQNVSLSDVIRTLEIPFQPAAAGRGGSIDDFQAEFFQQSQLAAIDRVQRGQGDVSFKFLASRNDRVPLAMFRWEYRQPSIQEIVSDGRIMWVYLPENGQVIETDISAISQQQGENPVTFLSGLGNLSRDFNINWAAPNLDRDGNYILELQPQRISSMIQTLLIVVDRRAVDDYLQNNRTGQIFPILATTVIDPNDNRTTIEFRAIRVNRNLSARDFEFRIPAGVEVVRPGSEQMGF